MERMNPNADGASCSKKRKPNDESDQNESAENEAAVAIPDAPNQQQTADLLKLNIDCFEESFDYLPIDELLSVGRTCKRLHQVVGHILNENYMGSQIDCRRDNGFKWDRRDFPKCFGQFVRNINIKRVVGLDQFHRIQSSCHQLRGIKIRAVELTEAKLECLKSVSNKVERFDMWGCELAGNVHDSILDYFPSVKHFTIFGNSSHVLGNDWLQRKYPTLEHLGFRLYEQGAVIPELATFLELNPNIRELAINDRVLESNKNSLMAANVKLHELEIVFIRRPNAASFLPIIHLITELHQRGFYERLKISIIGGGLERSHIDQLASLNVVKLKCVYEAPVRLSGLSDLEQISIDSSEYILDWSELGTTLAKLKYIEFRHLKSWAHIQPLICQARRLKVILIRGIDSGGTHFNEETKVIDLVALNKEREKLAGATPVTIYVPEAVYLATKWALKETIFRTIRLKRTYSYHPSG